MNNQQCQTGSYGYNNAKLVAMVTTLAQFEHLNRITGQFIHSSRNKAVRGTVTNTDCLNMQSYNENPMTEVLQ